MLNIDFEDYDNYGEIDGTVIWFNDHVCICDVAHKKGLEKPSLRPYSNDAVEEVLKHNLKDLAIFLSEFMFHYEEWILPVDVMVDCINSNLIITLEHVDKYPAFRSCTLDEIYSAFDMENYKMEKGNLIYGMYKISSEINLEDNFLCALKSIERDIELATHMIRDRAILNPLIHNDDIREGLTSLFSFPAEIQAACVQYLIYFGQFLADLGIKNDVEIYTDSLRRIVFNVYPEDKKASLRTIKEALDVYLKLAVEEFPIGIIEEENNLAVSQLKSTVLHLQGQLLLTNTTLQLKNSVIDSKNIIIESLNSLNCHYKKMLEKDKEKDSEDIIPGILSVKKTEKGPFVLDIPALLRKLKRSLGMTN